MKKANRKLTLERTTIRPLTPTELYRVAGGTGFCIINYNYNTGGSQLCALSTRLGSVPPPSASGGSTTSF